MSSDRRSGRWRLAVAGAVLYVASILLTAPASVAAWAVARATDGIVQLDAPRGSFWRGRSSRLIVGVGGTEPRSLGEAAWRIVPLRILHGELAVEFSITGEAQGRGTVALQPGAMRLQRARFRLPAGTAASFLPALQVVRPRGEVTIESEELVFRTDEVRGRAQAVWTDASVALSAVAPLGTYRAQAEGAEGATRVEIATASGPLHIHGRGRWSPAAGFSFEGVARAAPGEEARLGDLLRLMGPRAGNGEHQLRYAARP